MELAGRVFTGQGEGKKYVSLSWVKHQIKEKLGFDPYPGTLNLRLDEENAKHRVVLERKTPSCGCAIPRGTAQDYCSKHRSRVRSVAWLFRKLRIILATCWRLWLP